MPLGRECFETGVLALELDRHTVSVDRAGRSLTAHLRPTEMNVLRCLMEGRERIMSREAIRNDIWGSRQS